MAKAESRCSVWARVRSVAEAGDGVDPVQAAALLEVVRGWTASTTRAPSPGAKGKLGGSTPTMVYGASSEDQRPSEHTRIAAHPRPPEGVGEDDGAGAAGHVLAGKEGAPELRADAQHVEEVGADLERGELRALGAVVPDDGGRGCSRRPRRRWTGRAWSSRIVGQASSKRGWSWLSWTCQSVHQAVGLGVGEVRSSAASTAVKTAAFRPMPMERVRTTTVGEARPAPEVADGVAEVLEQRGHGAAWFNGRAREGPTGTRPGGRSGDRGGAGLTRCP